jgi:hypothetical protein
VAPEPAEATSLPTLSNLVGQWIERHCVVGDSDLRGQPYMLTEEMWAFLDAHYGVLPGATAAEPALAWVYRRSQLVRPQKWGKGPFTAAIICAEAVGPVRFAGWAEGGEVYRCDEHGCDCGWQYVYEPGEPIGRAWATPLIQVTATSEGQTDNVYRQLVPMIDLGPLTDVIPDTGDTRINLPGGGRIDPVTSKGNSRLGNPTTFAIQDETGIWTASNGGHHLARTQRRGIAGMGGRAIETTNAWDPSENSVAQQTYQSSRTDIFRDFRQAPKHLSYGDRRERRRIHKHVYGDSWWVPLDVVESEAAELLEQDPANAERFFGNRLVVTGGTWLKEGVWEAGKADPPRPVPPDGTAVCGGFDGSDSDDWTAIRLETFDGYRFTPTYGPDNRPTVWNPAEWGGSIPRAEVHAAWDELARRYKLKRVYCDPRDWQSEIGDWALEHGDEVFVEWATYRIVQMHEALQRLVVDVGTGRTTHDACPITEQHVGNARKLARNGDRYILGKPNQHQKIDAAMADVLAHEAAADARADGWDPASSSGEYAYVF